MMKGLPREEDRLHVPEDEKELEPSPMATQDSIYDFDGGDDDDMLDLGFQLGKMRLTERIGGFNRPKMAEELQLSGDIIDSSPAASKNHILPGPAYIAPASGFFFGQGNHQASLIDFLPSRLAADRLVKQYFLAVHPLSLILHRPSFEQCYANFWYELSTGMESTSSLRAIVFAVMFCGAVSMDELSVIQDFGVKKSSLVENFKTGTETALAGARFLRTTKVQTLQAFVIYLARQLHFIQVLLVGTAVRMAECMGLHRDGEIYGLNPLEIHVRRLIWHTLCILDIRACEAIGPRPVIREDEFDTKLPLNIDDSQLHATGIPPQCVDHFTDSTTSLIRFVVSVMMREIWADRPRVQKREISLTSLLSRVEKFRSNMATKYDHLLDERIPIQNCAQVIKAILWSRLQVMVLHTYHNNVKVPMPDRLRNIMVNSGTLLIEYSVIFDTDPELKTWSWIAGALHQYHAAFLLLIEVWTRPQCREADRIWRCLDYIFESDTTQDRDTKAKKIIAEAQRKSATLSSIRASLALHKWVGQDTVKQVADKQKQVHNLQTTSSCRVSVDNMGFDPLTFGQSSEDLLGPQNLLGNTSSLPGLGQPMMMETPPADNPLADIDWEAFDALFPPNAHENHVEGPSFVVDENIQYHGGEYFQKSL